MSGLTHPVEDYDEDYRNFQEREDIPIHSGFFVEDIRSVEVKEWDRTGCRGAFINLYGMEGMCDAQIHEIPPGQSFEPQRHLHESITLVVSGNGATTIGEGENQTTFEWSDHSLFYIPRNTRYKHVNLSSSTDVRLLSVTPLPLLYTLLQQDAPIWNLDSTTYSQWSAIDSAEGEFYSRMTDVEISEGMGKDSRAYWESNFVSDIQKFDELEAWPERGGEGKSVVFSFRETNLLSHMSEFPSGRYKKAHRHHPGANVIVLSGSGYSLFWEEGDDDRRRIDWRPYTMFTPPLMWFHQHFNTSEQPARYLAIHAPQLGLRGSKNGAIEPVNPTNQIEYCDEDPEIREIFENELAEKGIENKMTKDLYIQ